MAISRLRSPSPSRPTEHDVFLTSKLRPPSSHVACIERSRLLHQIIRGQASTVTLITAPAGYGKTTLLSQWAATSTRPVAWLTVGESENRVETFLGYLIESIRLIDPTLTRLGSLDLPLSQVPLERTLPILISDLAGSAQPLALVFDDYHVISDQGVHDIVLTLIEHSPPELHLILSARYDPPIPLARKRVLGQVTDVVINDLRFTIPETEALFSGMGIKLSQPDLVALHERTTGWVAGLHMAAISLNEDTESRSTFFNRFGSSTRLVADYLHEEILRQQPDADQTFLLKTALLDRFSMEVYRAISNDSTSALILDRVLRANLFVNPLDDQGEWFSYDPLFRDFLRDRAVAVLDDDERRDVFLRASRWFEEREMAADAISTAIACRDWTRAVALIHPISDSALGLEETGQLVGWLHALPTDVLAGDGLLSASYAWAAVTRGDIADADYAFSLAERAVREQWSTEAALGLMFSRVQHARYQDDGDTALDLLERGSTAIEACASEDVLGTAEDERNLSRVTFQTSRMSIEKTQQAAALRLMGRVSDAAMMAREARTRALHENAPFQYQTASVELGCCLMLQGRLKEACGILLSAANSDLIYPSERRLARIMLAEIAREQGRFDDSQLQLDESLRSLEGTNVCTWLPHLCLGQARLAWSRGEPALALDWATRAKSATAGFSHARLPRTAGANIAHAQLVEADLGAALKWAVDSRLAPDDDATYAQLREHLVFARVLIAQGEADDAVGLLERLLAVADRDGRRSDAISLLVLLSLANQDLFELDRAVAALDRALQLGESAGYQRVFVDEGAPMARLLKVAQRRGVATGYSQRLLAELGETGIEPSKVYHQALVEPITGRELEVLRLIAVGVSNKEIADELFISISTVKRHITNLYGKLAVSTRTESIQKARQLGLLNRTTSQQSYDLSSDSQA